MLGLLLLVGCDFVRGYAEGHSAPMAEPVPGVPVGLQRLVWDDFNGLSTDTMERAALPWKLTTAALLANEGLPLTVEALDERLVVEYGFVFPERIVNWPDDAPQPTFDKPIGLVSGMVARSIPPVAIEAANTGCSTCHSTILHDAAGLPTRDVWVGAPTSNRHLSRFADDAFDALVYASEHHEETLSAVRTVYPDASDRELATLKRFVLPMVDDFVAERQARYGGLTPYANGNAGLTNGAATLQLYLGLLDDPSDWPNQNALAAAPSFGGLAHKRSILCDGVYAPPGQPHDGPLAEDERGTDAHRQGITGMVSLFLVGTLGVTPEVARKTQPSVREAVDYLFEASTPPFPGPVDATLADRGAEVYAAHCAECHGTFSERDGRMVLASFPNRISPLAEIGTDPVRAELVTERLVDGINATALGPDLDPARTEGYVAPPLTGLWATAPYLHNHSVPTLWHLMHPASRPASFDVGGHALDYEKLGVAGVEGEGGAWVTPPDYTPWSRPVRLDTTRPGLSNVGHDSPFDELAEDDKLALTEFLKRL